MFSDEEMSNAVADLQALCKEEYGLDLQSMLNAMDAEIKLRRLIGVSVKREFGDPIKRTGQISETNANNLWQWKRGEDFRKCLAEKPKEAAFLREVRDCCFEEYGFDPPADEETKWECFTSDVDHERALFKTIAVYLHRKANKQPAGNLRDLIDSKESPEFEFGLEIATFAAQGGIVVGLVSLGVPTAGIAVPLLLLIAKYGYAKIPQYAKDENHEIRGDNES